tara:strand:+ start:227 stop:427 length:201 start_codon:yes stop_codon:yes gene_type:complete
LSSSSSFTNSPSANKRGRKSFWTEYEDFQKKGIMQRKRQPQGFYTMTRTESQKTEPDTDDEEDYIN